MFPTTFVSLFQLAWVVERISRVTLNPCGGNGRTDAWSLRCSNDVRTRVASSIGRSYSLLLSDIDRE